MDDSSSLMFVLGHAYTRKEINASVGGSMRTYLPVVESKVVAACLSKSLSPKAPDVIFVGASEDASGALLAAQLEPVPVFVKAEPGRWVFGGIYQSYQSSKMPSIIEKHTRGSRSVGVVRVVLMKPVAEVPSVPDGRRRVRGQWAHLTRLPEGLRLIPE